MDKPTRGYLWWVDLVGSILLTIIALNFAYGMGYRRGRDDAIDAVVRTAPALIANVMDRARAAVENARQDRPHDQ